MEWDEDEEVLLMNWPETKTGSETTLSYGPDVDWEMDVIHSMVSYLVTNEGGAGARLPGEVNWLFPAFSALSSNNAAKKVNTYMKTCVGRVRPTMHYVIQISLIIIFLQ